MTVTTLSAVAFPLLTPMSSSAARWTGLELGPRVRGLFVSAEQATPRRIHPVIPRALSLALAYYLGARIGFAFQSPNVPQSVMWLPNSLLLAALLITQPRQWVWYLLSAFPAQLLVAWQSDAPFLAMSLLYGTNCLDAALCATMVRVASGGTWRLDRLRSLLVFLACAFLAPAIVSFLDAAITVWTGWGSNYWAAYGTRVRANTLTNVILVPAIVGMFAPHGTAFQRPSRRRAVEAAALIGGLLLSCTIAFSEPLASRLAFVYLPLTCLLWAAVRFGPGVAGGTLLIVAFVSSWYAMHDAGGFVGEDPSLSIVSLQFFLFCVSVPLLSLSMVVKEREAESRKLLASRDEIHRSVQHTRDLAGRLISAQEEESHRIGRELHDSVGQYVADLALTMSALKRAPAVRAAGLEGEFLRLFDHTSNMFESVRALSHQLHPSILRHAGLVAATDSLCRAFRRQYEVDVVFDPGVVGPIPDEASLCAYRVAQEALRNIAAHARARNVKVTLARNGDELLLSVVDDGRGFDTATASARGLGLVSMQERVRLVHGSIDVVSEPNAGCRIIVHLPLEALT